MTNSAPVPPRSILICQNLTCRKQGAAKVLMAFRSLALTGIAIEGCGCLGQCGNGPTALVLPDRKWYHRVRPDDVVEIVAQST